VGRDDRPVSGFVLIEENLVLNAAVMVVSLASIMIVTYLS